jgi:hypothetical protein
MVPPMISDEGSSSSESTQYSDHIKQEDGHQHHIHHNSMSPEERRHRNKLASAKYRAKKVKFN